MNGSISYRCVIIYMLSSVLLIFLNTEKVWAHDVIHEIHQKNAVIVTVGYETGEIMSYGEVTIYSPKDEKIEFQNGRTDANGSFAFVPDMPGEWKIVIDDGNGHGFSEIFIVNENMKIEITQSMFNRFKKLFAGIAMLFGLLGFFYYFHARKLLASR